MPNAIPLVSVIMPVHDEESTLAQAIESVIFQRTSFPIELIIVDDASSDNTPGIVKSFQSAFPQIVYLRNTTQSGKGPSVMRGYACSTGKYLHVLDGDDIFISWDKLQLQADFLNANDDFFAIGHNTAIMYESGELAFVRSATTPQTLQYQECVANCIYCHTSSYMFRKLGTNLPECFRKEPMRGDTALFFYHAFKHKSKIRYVPDLSSLYNFHGAGLWSALDSEARNNLNIACLECLRDLIVDDPSSEEHASLDARIAGVKQSPPKSAVQKDTTRSIDEILTFCASTASRIFSEKVKDTAFKGMYSFQALDQLCEAAGRTVVFKRGYTLSGREYDSSRIAILVSGFVPNGGGVFREIKELVAILLRAKKRISIISSGKIATDASVVSEHFNHPNIDYWQADTAQAPSGQLESIIDELWRLSPARIYPFITHHDAVLNASLQRGMGGEIIFDFVYDHGLSFAVHNSSIDKIIVKTISQANALAPRIDAAKLIFLPPFLVDKCKTNPYRPLRKGLVTTASAAARSYKVENDYKFSYFRIISDILAITGGTHYHYGPLSNEADALLTEELDRNGVSRNRFVHIQWANDLGKSLTENGVDLFLAPFPLCSARIAIEVMSCGIPIMNHDVERPSLPQAIDFVDPDQFIWRSPDELYEQVRHLSAKTLAQKSESARQHFLTHNDANIAERHILDGTGFELPPLQPRPDYMLEEISSSGLIELDPVFYGGVTTELSNTVADEDEEKAVERKEVKRKGVWKRTRPARRAIKAFLGSMFRTERNASV